MHIVVIIDTIQFTKGHPINLAIQMVVRWFRIRIRADHFMVNQQQQSWS